MTHADEIDLIASALEGLHDSPPVTLHLSAMHAWAIVANLQLAMRHPHNVGPTAEIARAVCESIIANFPPPLANVARMGFDSRYDT